MIIATLLHSTTIIVVFHIPKAVKNIWLQTKLAELEIFICIFIRTWDAAQMFSSYLSLYFKLHNVFIKSTIKQVQEFWKRVPFSNKPKLLISCVFLIRWAVGANWLSWNCLSFWWGWKGQGPCLAWWQAGDQSAPGAGLMLVLLASPEHPGMPPQPCTSVLHLLCPWDSSADGD